MTYSKTSNKTMGNQSINQMKSFAITGTYHGAIIYAYTEGIARKAFHDKYNGESIVSVKLRSTFIYS